MDGAAYEMNSTCADLNEKENKACLQSQRFHGEEITGQQVLLVLAETRLARCCSVGHVGEQRGYAGV